MPNFHKVSLISDFEGIMHGTITFFDLCMAIVFARVYLSNEQQANTRLRSCSSDVTSTLEKDHNKDWKSFLVTSYDHMYKSG